MIIDYTRQDFLGMSASLYLDVTSVAQLADFQYYMAEQKELIGYAVKRLEAITNNAVQIEGAIAEIVKHQLRSRSDVDKFISAANLPGNKYSADTDVPCINGGNTKPNHECKLYLGLTFKYSENESQIYWETQYNGVKYCILQPKQLPTYWLIIATDNKGKGGIRTLNCAVKHLDGSLWQDPLYSHHELTLDGWLQKVAYYVKKGSNPFTLELEF